MPKNNSLKPVKLPMVQKFDKPPKTTFKNNLDAIKVTLVSAPTLEHLRQYIPYYTGATWAEDPHEVVTAEAADQALKEMFNGFSLPSAKETISLVFLIEGISLQEVTHLIRHRNGSFSADCSGDKWWSDKDGLVPFSIQNSPGFLERYMHLVEEAKELYCDMIDSRRISIMDARYILPRCLSTFYYVRFNFNDCIAFINQRKDVQIQPETDNIIAYQMFDCLLQLYGEYVANCVDFTNPSPFYQKMARTGKATNLYIPEPEVDNFEWNEEDFIYPCRRKALNGTNQGCFNKFESLQTKYFIRFAKYGVKVPLDRIDGNVKPIRDR